MTKERKDKVHHYIVHMDSFTDLHVHVLFPTLSFDKANMIPQSFQ